VSVRTSATGDAEVLLVSEQMVRVVEPESESEQGRNGAQRDVRFSQVTRMPSTSRPSHVPLHTMPEIGIAAAIGTGVRVGQAEAGNFETFRQARQVVALLLGRVP